MSGAADSVYVAARRVLLMALEALAGQRDGVVVVGAHAIYLHVADADLQVAPFTTDADLALDPARLREHPRIEERMREAGFVLGTQPGQWFGPDSIEVDLMDPRRFAVRVAGPGALLVSKLVKLGERMLERPDRVNDKDALDVFRLLRMSHDTLAARLPALKIDPMAGGTTREAQLHLEEHFSHRDGAGVALVARAMDGVQDRADTEVQVSALARRLLERIS